MAATTRTGFGTSASNIRALLRPAAGQGEPTHRRYRVSALMPRRSRLEAADQPDRHQQGGDDADAEPAVMGAGGLLGQCAESRRHETHWTPLSLTTPPKLVPRVSAVTLAFVQIRWVRLDASDRHEPVASCGARWRSLLARPQVRHEPVASCGARWRSLLARPQVRHEPVASCGARWRPLPGAPKASQ